MLVYGIVSTDTHSWGSAPTVVALGIVRALVMQTEDFADFLSALIYVYTLIIFASIITSWVFSFGVRMPYSRPLNAVLDFLRDVTNPFLRLFRRFGLQFGPMDFSPVVGILVLVIGGRILVNLISPG